MGLRDRVQLPLLCCLVLCGSAASAGSGRAAEPGGEESAPVGVWYRSSEGCPDGSAFLARLRELGRSAQLAGVGDRVDFVVTLQALSTASSGRLERQTARGTVAIRELTSARCEEVAEGLALSLELALDPGASGGGVPAAQEAPTQPAHATPAAAETPALRDAGAAPVHAAPIAQPQPWRGGAQGSLTTGIAPSVAPGAALFIERGAAAGELSGRLSLLGSYGARRVQGARLAIGLLAARLEGCALGWDGGTWSLTPCLGAEAGLLVADRADAAGRSDRGPWASALALLRASIPVARHWTPEAQLALTLPLTRYGVGSPESSTLFRTGAIALQLALGMCWSP